MKKYSSVFVLLFSAQLHFSQVAKKVIVEHFTNTKCSICASRNPGFYSNYNAQSGVIHLAIHPSSPYSGCLFSQHNALENDARTNYYGIYGSTPRLVIQGVVVSNGANYASSSIFTPYLLQQSPASIKIVQSKYGTDSIRSRIVIKTEAAHTLPGLSLFVALAEDVVNYTGSNGEAVHYDVFRKSLSGAQGIAITLPANVGDSVVFTKSSPTNSAWNFSKIFTLAILQETSSKAVVQAQSVSASSNNIPAGIGTTQLNELTRVTFIPGQGIVVKQENYSENNSISLSDLTGWIVFTKVLTAHTETFAVTEIPAGIYLYSIDNKSNKLKTGKLIIH